MMIRQALSPTGQWIKAIGLNGHGQCDIPELPTDVQFVQVSAGGFHTVLLCSDGQVRAIGRDDYGQCSRISKDGPIARVSADGFSTIVLTTDGQAVAVGESSSGRCRIPSLPDGLHYMQVSAGGEHAALLRSDGVVFTAGLNSAGQCTIPPLPDGVTYVQVDAGAEHTVLLRSDGIATAVGSNTSGQCNLPALPPEVKYVQVSAGGFHTLLLRSDGQAVACGRSSAGQCLIAPRLARSRYVQVSAGGFHSVLLRQDGTVVAIGLNNHGQCNVASIRDCVQVSAGAFHTVLLGSQGMSEMGRDTLPSEVTVYRRPEVEAPPLLIVQMLLVEVQEKGITFDCRSLGGAQMSELTLPGDLVASEVRYRLREAIGVPEASFRAVLPSGRRLDQCGEQMPLFMLVLPPQDWVKGMASCRTTSSAILPNFGLYMNSS